MFPSTRSSTSLVPGPCGSPSACQAPVGTTSNMPALPFPPGMAQGGRVGGPGHHPPALSAHWARMPVTGPMAGTPECPGPSTRCHRHCGPRLASSTGSFGLGTLSVFCSLESRTVDSSCHSPGPPGTCVPGGPACSFEHVCSRRAAPQTVHHLKISPPVSKIASTLSSIF